MFDFHAGCNRFYLAPTNASPMRKKEFAIGALIFFASIVLSFVLTNVSVTYADLQPLAVITLILLVVGTLMVGHSIWHDLFHGFGRPASSSSGKG